MKVQDVLFVCLGNICRSPAAHGIFEKLVQDNNLNIRVDSAGTSGFHEGELADPRMREAALNRGLKLTSRSRKFLPEDYYDFDLIICMDDSNVKNALAICPESNLSKKIVKMTDFCSDKSKEYVPDPYYGGDKGFEDVLDLLQDCCQNLLKHLNSN